MIDPFVDWLPLRSAPQGVPRLAVKDVIDVAGLPTGCGHPDKLATARPAARDAECVQLLREAGAFVVGKTHTDELAYSLGGTNAHYGAVANPAAPGRLTGGSSSGSAAAVAAGRADLGLGTDTAGSIRVPAAYCGLWSLRPTHARVSRSGIAPLAPSFDVPGLLTRDAETLAWGARALLADTPSATRPLGRTLAPANLWAQAEDAIRETLAPLVRSADHDDLSAFEGAREAFSTVQGAEAWAVHGPWIRSHRPTFGPGVGARLAAAARITAEAQAHARAALATHRDRLHRLLADGTVLALPAAPGAAPAFAPPELRGAPPRTATLALTCLASLAGLPAVTVPHGPGGLCLIAGPGHDEALLALAATTFDRSAAHTG
ncbi:MULTISPECIES: amidase family protein [Streptacidiphilus]|uniref:Amidase family protein n=1 Tax=Streptacidiphilus cavernicola TaxID=3342716 RepID=A0ABV6UZU9_9ACTN|nr:amidase family protein [Streptacidiphilus jeojiense]